MGEVVRLSLTWGTQTRLKCVVCKRYLGATKGRIECKCGTGYAPTGTGDHEVVKVP